MSTLEVTHPDEAPPVYVALRDGRIVPGTVVVERFADDDGMWISSGALAELTREAGSLDSVREILKMPNAAEYSVLNRVSELAALERKLIFQRRTSALPVGPELLVDLQDDD